MNRHLPETKLQHRYEQSDLFHLVYITRLYYNDEETALAVIEDLLADFDLEAEIDDTSATPTVMIVTDLPIGRYTKNEIIRHLSPVCSSFNEEDAF